MIGNKGFLVRLIKAKTKISTEDIQEILHILPECMAEAFIQANPKEKELVDLGPVSGFWRPATRWGPSVQLKAKKAFGEALTRLRYEKNYPLASQLYEMMHPKTKERVSERGDRGGYIITHKEL